MPIKEFIGNILSATEFLFSNVTVVNVVMFFVAIISLFYTWRTRARKKLVFYTKTVKLTSEKIRSHDSVKITFMDEEVKHLSLTQVAIWNNGNNALNISDIAPLESLKIVSKDGVKMYSLEFVRVTNDAQNFSLEPIADKSNSDKHTQNEMMINFDYFEPNGGVLLQVLHTGFEDDDVGVSAVLKNEGKIKRIDDYSDIIFPRLVFLRKMSLKSKRYLIGTLLFVTPLIISIPQLIGENDFAFEASQSKFGVFFITAFYWIIAYMIVKSRIPKQIEPFSK